MRASRAVSATPVTCAAALAIALVIVATAAFLLLEYSSLPDLLPVHFNKFGAPNGWQYRTVARLLIPVGVQIMLALILGSVAWLLLSRPHGEQDDDAPDVWAAAAAAEAVLLIALIWVAFQGYAAFSLAQLWVSHRSTLPFYNLARSQECSRRSRWQSGRSAAWGVLSHARLWLPTGASDSSTRIPKTRRYSSRPATDDGGP